MPWGLAIHRMGTTYLDSLLLILKPQLAYSHYFSRRIQVPKEKLNNMHLQQLAENNKDLAQLR